MPIKQICANCGATFSVKPHTIKKGWGKYCSKKCYHDAQIKRVDAICLHCGKTFSARAEQIRRGAGKYCSNTCKYNSRLKQVECICLNCGLHFTKPKQKVERGDGKYCSKKCFGEANRGRPRPHELKEKVKIGLIAYFNTPGARERQSISQKKRFEDAWWYGSVNYHDVPKYCKKWNANLRERVRACFGYVCFECGAPQEKTKLHVHHVWYNKAMCCDNTPHTLVPLCKRCHLKTNHNRKYWSTHFQEIIDMYYNGKCWLTEEEMKQNDKELGLK